MVEQIDNLKALSEKTSQLSDSMAIMMISSAIHKQDPTLKVVWWSRCYGIVQVQGESSFTGDNDVRTTQMDVDSAMDFSSNEIEKVVVLRSHEMHSAGGKRARTLWRAYACSWVCGTENCKYTGLYHDLEEYQETCPVPWMNQGGNGSGSGSGTGGGSGSGSGSGTGGGSGNGSSNIQDAGSDRVEPEQEIKGSTRPQRSTPEEKKVADWVEKAQEKRKQFRRHCCKLSAAGKVCGGCKESMQQCNKRMRKLLEAADDKLNGGAELSKIQQTVYQLLSSSNMRKMFDAVDAPAKKKKTEVEEEEIETFMDVCSNIAKTEQMKVVFQPRESGEMADGDIGILYPAEEYIVQGRAVTPPREKHMHVSSSQDNNPDMKIGEVVQAIGDMFAQDRGYDSHEQHSAQAKQQGSRMETSEARKRLLGPKPGQRELRAAVREKTKKADFGWATVAIKKGLKGDMKLLQDKGEQLVQTFTTMLMADVNEGHSVMLHISGHWLLIAKIQDEITCFDPRKNGFCVFSCALQLWKRKMRLDVDETTTSLTPC